MGHLQGLAYGERRPGRVEVGPAAAQDQVGDGAHLEALVVVVVPRQDQGRPVAQEKRFQEASQGGASPVEARGVEGAVEDQGLPGGAGALQGLLQPGPLPWEIRFAVEDEELHRPQAYAVEGPLQAKALELGGEAGGVVVAEGGVEGDRGEVLQEGLHDGPFGVEVVPHGEEGGNGLLGVLLPEKGRHLGPAGRGRPPVAHHRQALA